MALLMEQTKAESENTEMRVVSGFCRAPEAKE
jgi:hypothetical protein